MASTFTEALIDAMDARGLSQGQLAAKIGVRQNTISRWLDDEQYEREPPRDVVFAMEAALDLPPGNLSRHLGYLPLGANTGAVTLLDAIRDKTDWTEAQRNVVRFTVNQFDQEAGAARAPTTRGNGAPKARARKTAG